VICGREDRIVDSQEVYSAVKDIPNYRFVMVPSCGHAPQLECSRLINRLVVEFLSAAAPAT
ncbi:MAG TPA: alpha/beta hydrolase, partial [Pirellulales bacterium]|nr:alpha/beta hydrolase [Pirellulales bacterium]